MESAFYGIDPGKTGSICLLVPSSKKIEFVPIDGKLKDLYNFTEEIKHRYHIQIIMIEDVHSVPQSSAKSNFSFGRSVQRVHDFAELTSVGIDLVQPKVWQKELKVKVNKVGNETPARRKARIKQQVKDRILELYPMAKLHGPKGGYLDGRGDALAIAHYAYIKYTGMK